MAVFPVPGGPARRHARPAIFLLLIMSTTIPAAYIWRSLLFILTVIFHLNLNVQCGVRINFRCSYWLPTHQCHFCNLQEAFHYHSYYKNKMSSWSQCFSYE
jgi:hypothetical protein